MLMMLSYHYDNDALGSGTIIWLVTRYDLRILHYCGKRVKTESQKDFSES